MTFSPGFVIRRFAPLATALALMPACNLICPYNADQVFESRVRAECHFYFACCTAGEADVLRQAGFPDLSQYRDEGACVDERMEEGGIFNETFSRAITQAIQGGRFEYDYATAETCAKPAIDAMNNCDADFVLGDAGPVEVNDACEGIPGTGLVGEGDPCFFDFECAAPGSRCLTPFVLEELDSCSNNDDCRSDEECINGLCIFQPENIEIHDDKICINPIPEGERCDADPDFPLLPSFCEAGTFCLITSAGDPPTCEFPFFEGDECFNQGDDECEAGTFCETDNNGDSTCELLKQEGDDCNDSGECDIGLFCDFSRNEPSCEAPIPVDVFICDGIQGADDPDYDNTKL